MLIRQTLLLTLLFLIQYGFAQTNVSGVVNTYIDVTAVNVPSNSITVSSAAGFSVGDQVLLIQMQGATISQTDDANYGTISSYANAGNYEILHICDIVGNVVTFAEVMLKTYTPSGKVQMIYMPVYANANISGSSLSCQAWNGTTGGVLVLEVTGTLNFGTQNIDVSGLGFRGPAAAINSGSCSFTLDATYYQPITNTAVLSRKAEGIANEILNKETGRGPQANGGGGGNNHNGGGGGGGNYGYGGAGGVRVKSSNFTCGSNPGVNSKNLVAGYALNKVFMGGGGGAGNGNNVGLASESGEDGGAIVIIRAGNITGNNRSILADGIDVVGNSDSDGAGGGGAGGTVFLEVGSYTGNLNISVTGGNGGSTDNSGTSNCNGPGGGGGGGLIWVSAGALPGAIIPTLTGGTNGIIATTTQANCTLGSANQSVAGQVGGTLTGLLLNESTTNYAGCALPMPVELISFSGYSENRKVYLNWQSAFEQNNDFYSLLRSNSGENFEEIGTVDAVGNSLTTEAYSFVDEHPSDGINYYRLVQRDVDGAQTLLGTLAVDLQGGAYHLKIVPNPVTESGEFQCYVAENLDARYFIMDVMGHRIQSSTISLSEGFNSVPLQLENMASGNYILVLEINGKHERVRFVKN